jgi:hypothetical protein
MSRNDERKTEYDKLPVHIDKVRILRAKSEETGKKQYRLLDELIDAAMRQRGWLPAKSESATEPVAA